MNHTANAQDASTKSLYDAQMQIQVMEFLFINRRDVFAQFYEEKHLWFPPKNKNTGAYESINGGVIYNHLCGTRRIGAYSTNIHHQVKWIAADFDDNENAYAQCVKTQDKLAEYGLSSHVERSSSGKGYHLWVFFTECVPASEARRLMIGALTEAGVPIKGRFSKGSNSSRAMDRLIPTQDKLPPGGLGNLICLPLNGKAMANGNTCFLDEDGEPYANQFAYLYRIAWEGRVDIASAGAQRLISLIQPAENPTEDRSWSGITSGNQLELLRECEAIKEGIRDANQFNNFTWMGILTNIAVFGSKGRDLAHEFSAGYDMRHIKNDPGSVYTEDETDRVYFHKVDYIQKGGHPTSCKRLAEEGWECPLITQCTYKHIARYGADPFLEFPDIEGSTRESFARYGTATIYDTFMHKVMNTNLWRTKFGDAFFIEGVWLGGEFTPYEKPLEYDVIKMLLGMPSQIEAFGENGQAKFVTMKFATRQAAGLFASTVQGLVDDSNTVWLFYNQPVNVCVESAHLYDIAENMGLYPLTDPLSIDRWVEPPFRANVEWGEYKNGIEALMNLK